MTVDRLFGVSGNVGFKVPVRVATTASITLSGEQTIDGQAVVAGDRVMAKDQSSDIDNGIYIVDTGSWTRAPDFDGQKDVVDGSLIYVRQGTVNGDTLYSVSCTDPVTVDEDSINFVVSTISASQLVDHINDTSGAHPASAISYAGAAGMTATDVEGAIDELAADVANALTSADIGSTVQAYDADTAKLDVEQSWSAQQTPFDGVLTDGATINWNGDSDGQVVSVTLGGNRTVAAPTNINENALYVMKVIQDGTGGRTLAWNSAYKFPSAVAPTLSAGAAAVDVFSFIGGSGNTLLYIGQDVR